LSLALIVQCVVSLHLAPLPIPIAILYIIFQAPLELPCMKIWALILASVLASIGLAVMLPRKRRHNHGKYRDYSRTSVNHPQTHPDSGENNNNPSINVIFGSINRSLRANSLETARLSCNFGAMRVFFDQVEPSPSGAEVILNCSFGGIELFIPKHWRVIDKLNCSLGGVDIDKNLSAPAENAPKLTLSGSVSLSGIDVRSI